MKYITSKSEVDSSERVADMPASVYEVAGEIADAVQLVIDEAKNMHAVKRAREAIFSDDEDVSDLRPDAKPFIPKEDPRYKTAMCFNKACPHGDKCTFAHSEDELRKRMCRFGGRCRNVTKCGESWENVESAAVCVAYHPDETLANHISREKEFKSRQKPSYTKQISRVPPVFGAFMPKEYKPTRAVELLFQEKEAREARHMDEQRTSALELTPERMYREILQLRNEVRNLKIEVEKIRGLLTQ